MRPTARQLFLDGLVCGMAIVALGFMAWDAVATILMAGPMP